MTPDRPGAASTRGLVATALAGFLLAGLALGSARAESEPEPPPVDVAVRVSPSIETLNERFPAAAAKLPRGALPRYWLGEQVYWTALGAPGDGPTALLDEDGLLEVGPRSFALEPFVAIDGKLAGWADGETRQSLVDGVLPIPSVVRTHAAVSLTQIAFVAGEPGDAVLYAMYRLANGGEVARNVSLLLALRPFQVNPPWQSLNGAGGVSPIRSIAREGRLVRVDDAARLVLLSEPAAFGAASGEDGSSVARLEEQGVPAANEATDPEGLAWGVLRYDFALAPGERAEVDLAAPLHDPAPLLAALPAPADSAALVAARLQATVRAWRALLAGPEIRLPSEAGAIVPALRAAVGQLLVARAGPALQPGTRTYARAWIRDGVGMATALLQMGRTEEARAYVDWFADFQNDDGTVPCCIDARGADPAVEHDSHGQLIHGIVSVYRFGRDREFLRAHWRNVEHAAQAIDALRQQRRTPAYETAEKRHFYGLLPESISHEGYWQNPVHSYWDDLWALRGLEDAVFAAHALGKTKAASGLEASLASFRDDFRASVLATMAVHDLDTLPASADLGDFDPTATAIALAPGGARELLPADALARTYDRYVADFRARRSGARDWDAYTPYELRNVEALVRLGRRDDALFLVQEILADQRPAAWREWAEVVWRDPRAPKFLGDMPHGWVAAGYIRAVRSLLAYEEDGDESLVLAAGLPLAWARAGVSVRALPTEYGPLGYRVQADGDRGLAMTIDAGLTPPPGGIRVRLPARLRSATVNGQPASEWTPDSVTIHTLPATLALTY